MVSYKRTVHDTRGTTLSKTNHKHIFKEMVLLPGMTTQESETATSTANVKVTGDLTWSDH